MKRECGSCTKCCEGYLSGEALGYSFYPGKPCHFIAIGKGCTIYAKRPKEPCVTYKCGWLTEESIPEWLKPDFSNVIIDYREKNGHKYLNLIEAGGVVSSKVLSWFISYGLNNKLNIVWQVEGGYNWIGTEEFIKCMKTNL
jgi:hypothetical protein